MKIDIHVGPQIVVGRLEQKSICDCGLSIVNDDVALGKQYDVDIKSVRWVKFQCKGCGKEFPVRVIDAWNSWLVPQWFFLDLLDIGAAIRCTPLPAKWEPVRNNMVAPAHGLPGGRIIN